MKSADFNDGGLGRSEALLALLDVPFTGALDDDGGDPGLLVGADVSFFDESFIVSASFYCSSERVVDFPPKTYSGKLWDFIKKVRTHTALSDA